MNSMLTDGPDDATHHLIFAHGAGAGMESAFLVKFAALLAGHDLAVHRFEFGYMAARRHGGSRRPPPRAETLAGEFLDAVRTVSETLRKGQTLVIGGKSMGGRVASLVAQQCFDAGAIQGLVCVGYPFHPPGKPTQLRTAHLADLSCPTLIVQGTRDPFGTRDDVAGYALSRSIGVHWIENGDHDLKGGGRGVLDAVSGIVAGFVKTPA